MQVTVDLVLQTLAETESTIRARFARRLSRMNQRFDLDDLCQTVAVKAVVSADACRAESMDELRHWILTIAKYTCESAVTEHLGCGKRSLRAEAVAIGESSDESRDGYQPAADDGDQLTAAIFREQVEQIVSVIDRLPQLQQVAVRRMYLDGAQYEVIAREMGISAGAVRSLVSRGLKLARKYFEQPGLF